MKIDANNYDGMRAWMAQLVPQVFPGVPPESDPIRVLDQMFAKSPAKARKGLSMAIGDIVEATEYWPIEKVAAIDSSLNLEGLPTLTDMRLRFSQTIRRIVSRGKIRDDIEYYAVRNMADLADDDTLWKLLAAYEDQAAG